MQIFFAQATWSANDKVFGFCGHGGNLHLPKSMCQKFTLLQIDDNPDDRLFLKEAIALTSTPFEYHEADSMESAVAYFELHPESGPRPDLVVLDDRLGRYTGLEFLYWLRVLKKETSILTAILSGASGGQMAEKFYAAGADYFLAKPASLERLKTVIRTLHIALISKRYPGRIALLKEYQPRYTGPGPQAGTLF